MFMSPPCGTRYLHKINDITDQKRIKENIWCVKPTNLHSNFTEQEKDMYAVDFDNATKALSVEQQSWLRNALSVAYPDGHKWLNSFIGGTT